MLFDTLTCHIVLLVHRKCLTDLIEKLGGKIVESVDDIESFPPHSFVGHSSSISSGSSSSSSSNKSTSSSEPWLIAIGNPYKFRRPKYVMSLAKGEI